MNFKKLPELISNNAAVYPEKICLFFKDKSFTFTQMEHKILHTACALQANGVKKGDRVAVLLENSPEFIFAYFGILKLGAVAVPTNVFLKDLEISANLNDCSAEYIITSETFADRMTHMRELAVDLKTVFTFHKTSFDSVIISHTPENGRAAEVSVTADDLAMILYTSGTTGRPKGVMLTHSNLLENAKSFSQAVGMIHEDRMLLLLPMFHATSLLCCILTPLVEGGSIIVLESILEVSRSYYPEMLSTLRPSIIIGVPALYVTLSRARATKETKADFPFRLCICGGAPLPMETIDRFKEVYGVPILEGYGLSEASPAIAFNPSTWQKPGTIGRPVPNVEVRIVDENDNDLPVNTPGELCARGPNIMKGYWNQPEETAKALKNGWLHTGDVATRDEDGFLAIVDRIKDLILVKGMNVYPREVEEVLYKYNGVLSAAVVGIPDGEGSEIPIAFIKADPAANLSVEELKEYVRRNVASYKVPRRFVITDDMPVNAGGKVLKKELRERARKEFA